VVGRGACHDARMTAADPRELDDAVAMVREAGELTMRWFRSASLTIDAKGDGTPVTEADRAAERLLRERIAERWPDDAITGEEEEDRPGTSGRTWIIDPIDGTKTFTCGVPLYTNLLALHDDDGAVIGVINVPALGICVWAGRGLGCFENGDAARVSDTTSLDGAYLSSSGFDHWRDEALLAAKAAGAHLRTWGDGYGFVLVATGRIDAMVDPMAAVWDVAPMPVILAEAGGRFTDISGNPGVGTGGAIATNGLLHDAVLGLVGR
jgi:histidinol-phosphatase